MKTILEALGKAVQGLLSASTLWFAVAIAAITCLFLTLYANNEREGKVPLLNAMGCPPAMISLSTASVSAPITSTMELSSTVTLTVSQNTTMTSMAISMLSLEMEPTQAVTGITTLTLALTLNKPLDVSDSFTPTQDLLGICSFIGENRQWTGLIVTISIIMLVIGGALWAWQILFPVGGNPRIEMLAIVIIIIGGLLWAWQQPWPNLFTSEKSLWKDLIAIIIIIGGGLLWAWQIKWKLPPAKGDGASK